MSSVTCLVNIICHRLILADSVAFVQIGQYNEWALFGPEQSLKTKFPPLILVYLCKESNKQFDCP